jgi:hypothetical protein
VSWVDHPLHCSCVECVAGDPCYAGKRGAARSLIERLSRRGVSFKVVGEKFRFRPTTLLTDEEGAEIRRVRDEVYQLLREDDERWRRGDGNVRDQGKVFEMARLAMQPRTTVVNRYSGQPYDVYIGRGKGGRMPKTGRGMWGNPFKVGIDGTPEECIQKFERYLLEDRPDLVALIPTDIKGKVLGCTCKPKPCHGDALARLADSSVPIRREAS